MTRNILRFLDSLALDRGRAEVRDEALRHVHRALTEPPGLARPSPALRGRIMDAIREHPAPRAQPGPRWGWAATAAACLVIGWGVVIALRPPSPPASRPVVGLPIPTPSAALIQRIAITMDKPFLDQAQMMMEDTRRATRVVVSCVPFVRRVD
jgi:hypothetical protein